MLRLLDVKSEDCRIIEECSLGRPISSLAFSPSYKHVTLGSIEVIFANAYLIFIVDLSSVLSFRYSAVLCYVKLLLLLNAPFLIIGQIYFQFINFTMEALFVYYFNKAKLNN